jgi:hypothetical protein
MKKIFVFEKEKIIEFFVVFAIICIAAVLRILPHLPNFTPIAAMALLGGMYLRGKYSFIIPIGAMLISDYFIGFYDWKLMASVYVGFLLIMFLGFIIKNNRKVTSVIGAGILGSLVFFLITNFSFWYFMPFYEHSISGLAQAYIMGIPFLKNSILGDLFYVIMFVGAYELASVLIKKRAADSCCQYQKINS